MVELAEKVYLFIFVAIICQKIFFQNGAGGHLGFTPLEKNAGIFAWDTGAQYFLKGSRKSNQSSKHLSQKVVMNVRCFTLLYSNHPRAAAASSYLAIIFGQIASGVPWFLHSTAEPMQHPHQCMCWYRPW